MQRLRGLSPGGEESSQSYASMLLAREFCRARLPPSVRVLRFDGVATGREELPGSGSLKLTEEEKLAALRAREMLSSLTSWGVLAKDTSSGHSSLMLDLLGDLPTSIMGEPRPCRRIPGDTTVCPCTLR
eukprot:NODE_28277_length_482_cov_9.042254.p1 GENE.NODE_28277_length_482_cov_9.042254~~NODE_28277_length_482_cov_9.042254.p1  ORF type:complete len:129 (-),score=8.63 NODE_28277_length_482_cov_9.042254:3-389(-)